MEPQGTSPPHPTTSSSSPPPGDMDELVEAPPPSSMEIMATLDGHVEEDQTASVPSVQIVLDGSDILDAAIGDDGIEISIKFEKNNRGEEEDVRDEGAQTDFVNQLDGVEVKVYLDGTQSVDVEVIPPDNDGNGEDELILANVEAPQLSLEEVLVREETVTSVQTGTECNPNLLELTSEREVEYECEHNGLRDGEKKRIREEEDEDPVRNLKSKSDQSIDKCGTIDMETEDRKEKKESVNAVKIDDSNELEVEGENSVQLVIEDEIKTSDQNKQDECDEGKLDTNKDVKISNFTRRKRRKIAILLAYCGAGYQGMQKNPGAVTIEGELEKALVQADAMPENFDGNHRTVDWMRAARTDKGVSAVGQIVSGFFYVDPPGFVERVNSHLPKQIRVFGFTRVTPSFGAKKFCDRRRYEYVIPIFALDPTTHRDTEFVVPTEGREEAYSKCLEHCQRGRHIVDGVDKQCETIGTEELGTSTDNNVDIPKNVIETVTMHEETNETLVFSSGEQKISSKEVGKDLVQIQSNVGIESTNSLMVEEKVNTFHYGESERTKLNRILNKFVGTHNFHNFTSKMKAEDPSAKRYIVSFEAGNVFTVRETELIRCTVVGQSFVLHQIRKMIGLAIAVFRGCAPESMIDLSLRRDMNFTIPTAPELGLFLDECMFPAYNKKWYGTHEEISQKGYEKEISHFKHEIIYPHIAETERKEGQMALFLHTLNSRNYADFATTGGTETQ